VANEAGGKWNDRAMKVERGIMEMKQENVSDESRKRGNGK
jgi:hypothetical protein